MATTTKIQWCDTTVNPTTGCDGCELWNTPKGVRACYSGPLHEGRLARSLPTLYAPNFEEVRLAPGRMARAAQLPDLTGTDRPDKPWLDGMPRVIFVGDMGDIFSRDVPFPYLRDEVMGAATSKLGARHTWMLLTKQPRRMVEFARWLADDGVEWPTNVWAGTSVTGPASLKRVRTLLDHPAAIRFVSVEPLLADIGFPVEFFGYGDAGSTAHYKRFAPIADRGVDLLIVGGESDQRGHEARPFDVAWARKLIEVSRGTPLKVFVKQLGSLPYDGDGPGRGFCAANLLGPLGDGHGGDWSEWPATLRVREFPAPAGGGEHAED